MVGTAVASLALIACGFVKFARDFAGGGGATERPYLPPGSGEAVRIELDLYVWGGDESITGRYHDVRMIYTVGEGGTEEVVAGRLVLTQAKRERYRFVVPLRPSGPRGTFQYRFSMVFDGIDSTIRGVQRIELGDVSGSDRPAASRS